MSPKAAAYLSFVGLTALIVGWAPGQALANSRFTVENQTDKRVKVAIFSGSDTICNFSEKTQNVAAGNTETFGCTGGGNQRCKIDVQVVVEGPQSPNVYACARTFWDACLDSTINIPNKSTLTVYATTDSNPQDYSSYSCSIE